MIKKRWGHEEMIYLGPYMVKRIVLKSGKHTSMHYHAFKTETLIIEPPGVLLVRFDDGRIVRLEPHETLTIPNGRAHAHQMINEGGVTVSYIEASTPHPTDSFRVTDTLESISELLADGNDNRGRSMSTHSEQRSRHNCWGVQGVL